MKPKARSAEGAEREALRPEAEGGAEGEAEGEAGGEAGGKQPVEGSILS